MAGCIATFATGTGWAASSRCHWRSRVGESCFSWLPGNGPAPGSMAVVVNGGLAARGGPAGSRNTSKASPDFSPSLGRGNSTRGVFLDLLGGHHAGAKSPIAAEELGPAASNTCRIQHGKSRPEPAPDASGFLVSRLTYRLDRSRTRSKSGLYEHCISAPTLRSSPSPVMGCTVAA